MMNFTPNESFSSFVFSDVLNRTAWIVFLGKSLDIPSENVSINKYFLLHYTTLLKLLQKKNNPLSRPDFLEHTVRKS